MTLHRVAPPLCAATMLVALFGVTPASAHGFGGSGWLHPLTGPDHMLAMLAVGAWSAQLGGRAVLIVPVAFLCAMAIGASAAVHGYPLPITELAIAVSLLILGLVIATGRGVAWPLAAMATALFGLAHGCAHGSELPQAVNAVSYIAEVLATTTGLHVAGVVGGLLLLERPNSHRWIGGAGLTVALVGAVLVGTRLLAVVGLSG